ncbi:MAG: prolyl-tRNA synthetase associated domain-containing protein [Eubacteriaceae bacterium]|nr:prolyl-tRNA synthetase associated domain-containing protein [Eubacteriaceae bacterium]
MNKAQIYQYLCDRGISYEITEHGAVYTMEDLESAHLPYPQFDAKNLFVRDDKKRNFYMITVRGDKKVNLKEFRKNHGLRNLSFASAEELAQILKLTPGAVTPLGLLNDELLRVSLYIDSEFSGNIIGIHPNDNTATLWLKTSDLIELIRGHGNEVNFAQL